MPLPTLPQPVANETVESQHVRTLSDGVGVAFGEIPIVAGNPQNLVAGMRWYDSTDNSIKYYNGTAVVNFVDIRSERSILYPATAAQRPQTGAPALSTVSNTNFIPQYLAYDASSTEIAYFVDGAIPHIPSSPTLEFEIFWTAAAVTGGVRWRIRYVAIGDDENSNPALSNTLEASATVKTTTEYLNRTRLATPTPISTDEDEELIFSLERVADHTDDTMSGDAKVRKVVVNFK